MRSRTKSFPRFGRRPWELLLGAASLFLFWAPLSAQTVRPLIDENPVKAPGDKATGRIEYVNDSLDSLTVMMDIKSYTVSDLGALSYRPLDGDIHVKLSAMSFRIPPKQSYLVFYEASADKLPSWFVAYATFSGFKARTQDGFKIQIELPHTVYLLPKQQLQKTDLTVKLAEYHPDTKKIVVRVENTGPEFGRVLEADATSSRAKTTQGGFPVFPHSERQVEIPWDSNDQPAKLQLRLERFKLEQSIRTAMQ
jgi:hypothetical protein